MSRKSLLTMLEFMVAGRSNTELGRAVNKLLSGLFRFNETFCQTAFASHDAPPERVRIVITLIVSTLRGLRFQHIVGRQNTDAEAVKAFLVIPAEHLLASGAEQTLTPALKKRA